VKEYFRIRSLRIDLATQPQCAATTAEARAVRGDCHFARGSSIKPAAGGVKPSDPGGPEDKQAHRSSRRMGRRMEAKTGCATTLRSGTPKREASRDFCRKFILQQH
jgi:hypothetical protein